MVSSMTPLHCVWELTRLGIQNSPQDITALCEEAVRHAVYGVCVYPRFVPQAAALLKDTKLKIISVAGGFPDSQLPLDLKLQEVRYALKSGAQEIDCVLNVGEWLKGSPFAAVDEIKAIKDTMLQEHPHSMLKVILETCYLTEPQAQEASEMCLLAGADFIKTSTGKGPKGACLPKSRAILKALVDFAQNDPKKLKGFKAAGGIKSLADAKAFWELSAKAFKPLLDSQELGAEHFRIGASKFC